MESKVVLANVASSSMKDRYQQLIVDITSQAVANCADVTDLGNRIRNRLNQRFGKNWVCIVGTGFTA